MATRKKKDDRSAFTEGCVVFQCPYGWERATTKLHPAHIKEGKFLYEGKSDTEFFITKVSTGNISFYVASTGTDQERLAETTWRLNWVATSPPRKRGV